MRIDRHFHFPIPAGSGGKPKAVTAVEPVRLAFRESATFRTADFPFQSARIQKDLPVDWRVRRALKAYLNYQESLDEYMTLLYGVDVYV